MKPVIIIAILVPIIVAGIFAVALISSLNPQTIKDDNQSDEIAWQLLQKTYLEQECREQYMGQLEELEECYDRIDQEQRLNPPKP